MMVMAASCGGGSSVATSSSTSISGTVTDAIVDGAAVKIISSNLPITHDDRVLGTATSTAAGAFTVTGIDLTKYAADDVFFVIAEGGTVNDADVAFLKFKSIIGSKTEIDALDGDGVVNADEIPDLTVSNVSTAKVALVEAAKNIVFDDIIDVATSTLVTGLSEITDSEAEQEDENLGLVLKLAGNIKAAVDNAADATYTNELGTKDIAEYIKDAITVTNGVVSIDDTKLDDDMETLGATLEDAILADEDLMESAVGEVAITVEPSSVEGTWYGYHVDTWGKSEHMGGPELATCTVTVSTTAGCDVDMDISDVEGSPICGVISSNVLKFKFDDVGPNDAGGYVIEAIGTLDSTGSVLNGSYSMVDSTGTAVSGGIFKMKKGDTTDYTGTYSFTGTYTVIYVSPEAEGSVTVGTEVELTGGTITITSTGTITEITGSVTAGDVASDIFGFLEGPMVKLRISPTGVDTTTTTFVMFLMNAADIAGLYMDFDQVLTEPSHDIKPYTGGKFKLDPTTWAKTQ